LGVYRGANTCRVSDAQRSLWGNYWIRL